MKFKTKIDINMNKRKILLIINKKITKIKKNSTQIIKKINKIMKITNK